MSGQNHLTRHNERGKKTGQTEEEVGGQHQGMDRPGVRQVPEGSGEQGKMEKTGCKIMCGAPTTLAVKGLLVMMMTSSNIARSPVSVYSVKYLEFCCTYLGLFIIACTAIALHVSRVTLHVVSHRFIV